MPPAGESEISRRVRRYSLLRITGDQETRWDRDTVERLVIVWYISRMAAEHPERPEEATGASDRTVVTWHGEGQTLWHIVDPTAVSPRSENRGRGRGRPSPVRLPIAPAVAQKATECTPPQS